MITKQQISDLIDAAIEGTDLFVVEMEVNPGNAIHVVIDGDSGVKVSDCMLVSRGIEHNLDREEEDFSLKVESSGLTQAFKITRQYIKNVGREVTVSLLEGGKIEGELISANEEQIEVKTRKKERIEGRKAKQWVEEIHVLPYSEIQETKVVILFKKRK